MKITRVIFEKEDKKDKSLAVCSIVIEDSLKLNKIRLFKRDGEFYLVLPSKQDVYTEVKDLNSNNIKLPKCENKEKPYEEFFFPLESKLYKVMLTTIVSCFSKFKEEGIQSFRL